MKKTYQVQVRPIWTSENINAFVSPKEVAPVEFKINDSLFLTSPLKFGKTNLFTLTQRADHLFDTVDSFDPGSVVIRAFYFCVSFVDETSENQVICFVKTNDRSMESNTSEKPVLDRHQRKSKIHFDTVCFLDPLDTLKDRHLSCGWNFDIKVKLTFEMSLDGDDGEIISTCSNSTVLTASDLPLQIKPIGFDLCVDRENITASRLEVMRSLYVQSRTNPRPSCGCRIPGCRC